MRRRYKAVRLVEEMNLRIGRLQPLVDKLREISQRMVCFADHLAQIDNGTRSACQIDDTALAASANGSLGHPDALHAELRHFMRITLESPSTLARRIQRTMELQQHYDAAKRVLSAGNLRLVVRSPRNIATAA